VWRWAVAQRVAMEVLRGGGKGRDGVTVRRVGGREITTVHGAAGMKSIAKKRSEVGHG